MAAGQVVARPEDAARRRIEAGGAVASEVDIHAALFNGGRRGGVAVEIISERLGFVAMEQLLVVQDFARIGVDGEGEELVAIFGRGG